MNPSYFSIGNPYNNYIIINENDDKLYSGAFELENKSRSIRHLTIFNFILSFFYTYIGLWQMILLNII